MDAASTLRDCRTRAGLTLSQLAQWAGTSAATLSAYERGRVVPRVDTLDRIVRAAGFALDNELIPRRTRGIEGWGTKDKELQDLLGLALAFPFRERGELRYPPFRRST